MPKKSVALDGLLNTETQPSETGIPQRGAVPVSPDKKPATMKREGEKRATLALDSPHVSPPANTRRKNRPDVSSILESALAEYLKRANT